MRISVVTINYNKKSGLRRTLASLRGQTDRDFELIVVDGGSSDGSQEEIEAARDIVTSFVSERDDGIYDAWNKGISRASGDLIALLNSGDAYHPDVIEVARRSWKESAASTSNLRVLCGHTIKVEGGTLLKAYGNQIRKNLWFGIGIVHPATFVHREVYNAVGGYRPISIASDTDFVLRCVRAGVTFVPVETLVYMESGGVSGVHAIKAFGQYTEALETNGFCGPMTARCLAFSYAAYRTLLRREAK